MKERKADLLEILHGQTAYATGCTGPSDVFLAAGNAAVLAGSPPTALSAVVCRTTAVRLADVALPGTGHTGLQMALALGALCARVETDWKVPHAVAHAAERDAVQLAHNTEIQPDWSDEHEARVEVTAVSETHSATAVVWRGVLIQLVKDGQTLLDTSSESAGNTEVLSGYTLRDCIAFARMVTPGELDFLQQGCATNETLARFVLDNEKIGLGIGRALGQTEQQTAVVRAQALVAAACEGQLAGVDLPVFTVAGKGTAGIAATLPLVSYAADTESDKDLLLRAVALSCLVTTLIIDRSRKTAALCNCAISAGIGGAAGMALLRGGDDVQIEAAVQNVIPTLFGILCDGAKQACAFRLAVSCAVAMQAAELATAGVCLPGGQGVLGQTAEQSIDFLAKTARGCMTENDGCFCERLFEKNNQEATGKTL